MLHSTFRAKRKKQICVIFNLKPISILFNSMGKSETKYDSHYERTDIFKEIKTRVEE